MNKMLIAALLAMAGTAQAADQTEGGVYVGLGLGRADGGNAVFKTGGSPSFAGSLGYRFQSPLALELYWRSLSFELFPASQSGNYEYPDRHVGVAVVGRLPLGEALSATARLGVGRTGMDRSGSGASAKQRTSMSGGVGLSYALGRKVSVTLGYERFSKIDTGVTLLGAEIRF